jgi:HAD superfamily hydrolase (TIGR01459 family)
MTLRLDGLGPVVDRYDVFLFDMWGCLHDGRKAFAGVNDLLARLRALGKTTIALSNAPRRVSILRAQLPGFGLAESDFRAIVTSGEASWRALAARAHGDLTRYFHVGMEGNLTDPAEIGLREVPTLEDAQFVYATGAAGDGTLDMQALQPVIRRARELNLPMVCANPDLEVLRGEQRLLCAGTLAAAYEALGGTVHYHGKPHAGVYDWALELAAELDDARGADGQAALHQGRCRRPALCRYAAGLRALPARPAGDHVRGRPWTIRQYAGFSTAEASNAFYRKALAAGRRACRSPSIWPPTAATIPTIRAWSATWARPAWRSIRSRT